MNETARRIIDVIVENRRRFEEFCRSLSEEELSRPVPNSTWLVRDFIAHLGTLDAPTADWLEALHRGSAIDMGLSADGVPFDVDEFNDAEVAERRSWPVERVLEEAAANRDRVIAAIERLDDAHFDRVMRFNGDRKRRGGNIQLKLFMAGWAQHDPIHVADMLRGLPERTGDPALRSWTDNPFVAGYQRAMN
jgi:hypothetical protein